MNTRTGKERNRHGAGLLLAVLLAGCQGMPVREARDLAPNLPAIDEAARPAPIPPRPATPPPARRPEPPPSPLHASRRFDIAVRDVPARQFFLGLAQGTPWNLVVHPRVEGRITLDLKQVTFEEVLEVVRDVYGYGVQRTGHIWRIYPATEQTRMFRVNYLDLQRSGISRTRVSSGQISERVTSASGNEGEGESDTSSAGSDEGSETTSTVSGSEVETDSHNDFWGVLESTLKLLVGDAEGRRVMINPQAGLVIVRATPDRLRDVARYLRALQGNVARQVVLEARIIEVELNDRFQTGINWAALGEPGNGKRILGGLGGGGSIFENGVTAQQGAAVTLPGGLGGTLDTTRFGGVFALDLALNDFNALIELLKSQGKVQVLSSPRVATLNNQKAVIKVGTDEFFVTDVDTQTSVTSVSALNQAVNVELTPFFSGVALDVVPQIGEDGEVILHIHPTVSEVTEKVKEINVSTETSLSVPLALSSIRETDTVIRARSGQVVVIGGLMKDLRRDEIAGVPALAALPVVGGLFRHTRRQATKTELVILLRPIVVDDWNVPLRDAADRLRQFDRLRNDAGR